MPSVFCVACGNSVALAEHCAVCGERLREKEDLPGEGAMRGWMKRRGLLFPLLFGSVAAIIACGGYGLILAPLAEIIGRRYVYFGLAILIVTFTGVAAAVDRILTWGTTKKSRRKRRR